MAYVVKTARAKPAATTNTTLYQLTSGKTGVLASLRINNMSTATETVQVGLASTATPGATEWIFKGACEQNKPIQLSGDLIDAGYYVVVYNATGANVVFTLSLYEEA
jgi:hypothetical protein